MCYNVHEECENMWSIFKTNTFKLIFQNHWWTNENIIISTTHQINSTTAKMGYNSLIWIIMRF
jgi:hypothetical protein